MPSLSFDAISKRLPLFSGLDAREQETFLRRARVEKHAKGELITAEGMMCRHIAFVMRGVLRVFKLSMEGREVTLYRVAAGETCLLSLSCLLRGTPLPATVDVEEQCEVLLVSSELVLALLDSHPSLQQYLFQQALERLSQIMRAIDTAALAGRSRALAEVLVERSLGGSTVEITTTHQQLAVELGTAREVVSRYLRQWEKASVVSLKRGRIRVLDLEMLKEIASG